LGLSPRNNIGVPNVWQWGNQFSVYAGDFPLKPSRLVFGSVDTTLYTGYRSAYNFINNIVTPTNQYLVSLTNLAYSNLTFNTNASLSYFADVNYELDSIVLPNVTYTALINSFKPITGLVCNNASVSGCYYNGLCNDIVGKFQPFTLGFGDGMTYILPPQSFLAEDTNALVCRVKVARGTSLNVITLGTPWFRTFYTVYDLNYMQVNFALGANSFGSIME